MGSISNRAGHFLIASMMEVKGLAQNTRQQRIHIVRRFLNGRFASGIFDPDRIRPADIRRFVLGSQGTHNTGTIHVVGGAIRCYRSFDWLLAIRFMDFSMLSPA